MIHVFLNRGGEGGRANCDRLVRFQLEHLKESDYEES